MREDALVLSFDVVIIDVKWVVVLFIEKKRRKSLTGEGSLSIFPLRR